MPPLPPLGHSRAPNAFVWRGGRSDLGVTTIERLLGSSQIPWERAPAANGRVAGCRGTRGGRQDAPGQLGESQHPPASNEAV